MRSSATTGTRNRPPILITGMSPRWAAAYEAFLPSPNYFLPASGTDNVFGPSMEDFLPKGADPGLSITCRHEIKRDKRKTCVIRVRPLNGYFGDQFRDVGRFAWLRMPPFEGKPIASMEVPAEGWRLRKDAAARFPRDALRAVRRYPR